MNHTRIYYHNDLDGVMSAVLFAKLIREKAPKAIFHYSSVNYGNKNFEQTSLIDKYNSTVIVVDFSYHPQAAVWFDHHLANKAKAEELKSKGTIVPGKFDETAPSCANVIFNSEGRDKFIDEDLIKKVVDEVDMIDSASYPSIDDVYGDKSFGPKLRWAFQESYGETDTFTKELCQLYVEDRTALYTLVDNKLPDIAQWRYLKAIRAVEEAYKEFVKFVKQEETVVYYTVPKYLMCDRYFAFRYNIKCDYTVYILQMSTGYQVSVSKNPWRTKEEMLSQINVANVCGTYGGGGHIDVGGVPCTSLEDAIRIQREIMDTIKGVPF